MKVRGTKDIQEYRDEVICKLNLAYKKLNNLGNDPMQALFRLRGCRQSESVIIS